MSFLNSLYSSLFVLAWEQKTNFIFVGTENQFFIFMGTENQKYYGSRYHFFIFCVYIIYIYVFIYIYVAFIYIYMFEFNNIDYLNNKKPLVFLSLFSHFFLQESVVETIREG